MYLSFFFFLPKFNRFVSLMPNCFHLCVSRSCLSISLSFSKPRPFSYICKSVSLYYTFSLSLSIYLCLSFSFFSPLSLSIFLHHLALYVYVYHRCSLSPSFCHNTMQNVSNVQSPPPPTHSICFPWASVFSISL